MTNSSHEATPPPTNPAASPPIDAAPNAPSMFASVAVMVAMIVVIAAVGVFVIAQHEKSPTVAVSDAEVEEAARQTMLAFAYVGKYSRMTGVILRDEVIGGYVVEPVERAFAGAGKTETKSEHERSER